MSGFCSGFNEKQKYAHSVPRVREGQRILSVAALNTVLSGTGALSVSWYKLSII